MTGVSTEALTDAVSVADALVRNRDERLRAECERLVLVALWADTHPALPGARGQQVGASGTPKIALFAINELAVLLGVHQHAAHTVAADVANLRHRHPRLWARVQEGQIEAWVAVRTARMAAAAELTVQQARLVDEETAEHLMALPTGRYLALVEAKIIEVDQGAAEARREEAMRARFVRKSGRTEHGIKGIYGRATFGEVDHLYATVDRVAQILALQGDIDSADVRRSKALALLASPERVLELFAWAEEHTGHIDEPLPKDAETDDPSVQELAAGLPQPPPSKAPRPQSVIYVHVSLEALRAGFGIARVEEVGPFALAAVKELLGHTNVTVKPVVDLTVNAAVDAYEIPARLKEISRNRFPYEISPWGTVGSRKCDQDHSARYIPLAEGGPPGQTNVNNLGPLGRRAHRVKTFAPGWRHQRVGPRSFQWRTPTGYWVRVDPDGTTFLGKRPSTPLEQLKALLYSGE